MQTADLAVGLQLYCKGRMSSLPLLMISPHKCSLVSAQGSVDVNGDDDDYFYMESGLPCIPDVPESLKWESDSVDLDELPCIVPDDMQSLPEDASLSDPDEYRLPAAEPRAGATLAAAASSITRSQPTLLSPMYNMGACLGCGPDVILVMWQRPMCSSRLPAQ